jgi:Protein of unknown function (DUF4238)
MPQDQISKRHHYIPEFYLKRWSSGKGTLVEFSKPFGDRVRPKRVYPKQTGFVDRLYELRGVTPQQSQYIETGFFRPVDTKAATVLQKMEGGGCEFSGAERSAWSNFLMSLVLRHPENVTAIREHMLANVAEVRVRPIKARWRKGEDDPATVREILNQLGTEDGITRVALNTLVSSINSEKIGSALINTQWGMLTAPQFSPALLTSDRPLIWVNGVADRDFQLLLPLGPKRIFYAVHAGSEMEGRLRFMNAALLTDFMNEHVTRRAVRYVYSFGDRALGYVQARMGVDPRPTLVDQLLDLQRMRGNQSMKRFPGGRSNRADRPVGA